MDWIKFGYAVAGGACGAALTQVATIYREWRVKRGSAQFTALMLALILEDYADRCLTVIESWSGYDHGRSQEPDTSVPTLSPWATDTDWKSLGIRYTSDVMNFRVQVDNAHGQCSSAHEDGGPPLAWGEASDQSVGLGLRALELSGELRCRFGLPREPEPRAYDLPGLLLAAQVKLSKQREEWAARPQVL